MRDIAKWAKVVQAAGRVIRSGWTSQGPEVAAFEQEFADYVGAPHACAVSNCTTALHLALIAAGVKPGDEGIVRVYDTAGPDFSELRQLVWEP